MKDLLRPAALILSLAFLGSGCATTSIPIEVGLLNMQPEGLSIHGPSLLLEVRYTNPTGETAEITRARHRVTINGLEVGTTSSNDKVLVPRHQSVIRRIVINVRQGPTLEQLRAWAESGTPTYTLESRIKVGPPGRSGSTLTARHDGTLTREAEGERRVGPR